MQTVQETNFHFPNQESFYRGKVRDVYIFADKLLMIASDRISAFDVILPQAIPFKGQVLNQLSAFFLENTQDIVANWSLAHPDPNATLGLKCQALPIEMVIRGYLAGSAWRAYKKGQRDFNGYILPEGLQENDALPQAIITPSTKAPQGEHDEEISRPEILAQGLLSEAQYEELAAYTQQLFARGQEIVKKGGLIMADTKYEFGLWEDKIYLIDEIHTPDSARYFDRKGFDEKQAQGIPQVHRSKEMVRQWLMENNFMGRAGEKVPQMSEEWRKAISEEYISLYEQITGKSFTRPKNENRLRQMEANILHSLKQV